MKSILKIGVGCLSLMLAGCGEGLDGPPSDGSEGVVEAMDGRAAGELWIDRDGIAAGEQVVLQVRNRGEVALGFGRPIRVEFWEGEDWVETEASRHSAWTMDYLYAFPGQEGIEQPWPFHGGEDPQPGWYRFTKSVNAEDPEGESVQMELRARVRVGAAVVE